MRGPDLDKERCEKKRSLAEFLTSYNEGLPPDYPRATSPLLRKFNGAYPELFKHGNIWSLDQHRKRVMDWLPNYMRANPEG